MKMSIDTWMRIFIQFITRTSVCVDKGNSDLRSFAAEAVSPKPGGVHVGVDEAATSRGRIDGAQTKLSEPPSE